MISSRSIFMIITMNITTKESFYIVSRLVFLINLAAFCTTHNQPTFIAASLINPRTAASDQDAESIVLSPTREVDNVLPLSLFPNSSSFSFGQHDDHQDSLVAPSPSRLPASSFSFLIPEIYKEYTLQGSQNSFAQFKPWHISISSSSFSFQFRTQESNCLLSYMQSNVTTDYTEIKLVEGALRVRFSMLNNSFIVSIGKNLHDNQWHTVEIAITKEAFMIKADDESSTRNLKNSEMNKDHIEMEWLFLGGLPSTFLAKLADIHLPWSFFEPPFKGHIRGIFFSTSGQSQPTEQAVISSEGILHGQHKSCLHSDPCQHGGTCINSDQGSKCDCTGLDYVGTFCEKAKQPSEATFRGQEFIYWNNNSKPMVVTSDEISLYFKTRQSNGLLFYIGDGHGDYLNLAIRDGGVTLGVKLGSGLSERTVKPARIRFDDNQWHKVLVHRKVREITRSTSFCHFSITVDGVYIERGSTAGSFAFLFNSVFHIGGSDYFEQLPGSRVQSNFIGCLRKVEFVGDSLLIDILDYVKPEVGLFQFKGTLVNQCEEVEASDPITFTTKESFIALPKWEATKGGSLSLKIRTNEPNGVLIYSYGGSDEAVVGPSDFFALELLEGQMYLLLNLGSGAIKMKATSKRIDDSHWHVITLLRTSKSGRVTVDDSAVDFITPGTSNQLELDSPMYLGSVGPSFQAKLSTFNDVPPQLWAGSLKYGYIGCVRDLIVNNKAIDIASYARKQDSGSVKPSCHLMSNFCDKHPCFNDGLCNEGWNRFVCDCRATSFSGPVCGKDAVTLNFHGNQFMLVDLGDGITTQAEDVNLRFKTTRPSGLLVMLSSDDAAQQSYLIIAVQLSRLKLTINLGEESKVTYLGHGLSNDKWHTLKIQRRGPSLEVKLDQEYQITEITGQLLDLHYSFIALGALVGGSQMTQNRYKSEASFREVPNFVGSMQNFIINDVDFIEMSKHGMYMNFTVTASYGKKDGTIYRPFVFKSKRTYIGLPQLKAYSSMNLHFLFRTTLMSGLLLYNGGKMDDYIAIELVNGHLHYLFNMGDGPRRIKSSIRLPLNDGKWHSVSIGRPSLGQHSLVIDDAITSVSNTGPNLHLDLDGLLYLGGVSKEMYTRLPSLIQSRHGFEGCMASLELNGETIDPTGSDALVPSSLVTTGCPVGNDKVEKGEKTSGSTKGNRSDTSGWIVGASDMFCVSPEHCYCDDPSNPDECLKALGSASYKFGKKGGVITFSFPDKTLDTKSDHLIIAFSSESDNAILFRVDSGTSNDYMELQIFDGNILMVYNLGTEDHDIGLLDVKVNDGRVHVVQFTRSGPNSTLQIDNHNRIYKHPLGGRQLTVFNSHYKVQIGGKVNLAKQYNTQQIEKPFSGIISGLIYDGYRLLDMAMNGDSRIALTGDVHLVTVHSKGFKTKPDVAKASNRNTKSDSKDQKLSKSTVVSLGDADELIYSGEGSGRCWDDEDDGDDDCTSFDSDENSTPIGTDELITPRLVVPYSVPTRESFTKIYDNSLVTKKSQPCSTDEDSKKDCDNKLEIYPTQQSRVYNYIPSPSPSPTPSTQTFRSRIQVTENHQTPLVYTFTTPFSGHQFFDYTPLPTVYYPKPPPLPTHLINKPKPPPPTRPRGKPPIIEVPIPDHKRITNFNDPKNSITKRFQSTEATNNQALTIGITILSIFVTLIAFIIYLNYKKPLIGCFGKARNLQINSSRPIMTGYDIAEGINQANGSIHTPVTHIMSPCDRNHIAMKKNDNQEWYV